MRSWIWRISAVIALAFGLTASGLAAAAEPLTPLQFRDAYVAELQRQIPGAKVRVVSETELRIIAKPGDEEQIAYLDNAYRRYRAAPETLNEVLQRHVGVSVNAGKDGPLITPENAMVVVRHKDFLAAQAEMRSKPQKDGRPQSPLAWRALPGDLIMLIVSDQPQAYLYVSPDDLIETMGSVEAAWTRAIANTEGRIGEADGSEAGAIVILTTRNGSASSLLVVDAFWNKLEKAGLGSPVVFLADRNTLTVAFEGKADSIRDLKLIARGLIDEPEEFGEPVVSPSMLVRRNGKWQLYADYPYR